MSKRRCAFSQDMFAERLWHVALRVSALKCGWLPAFSKERKRFSSSSSPPVACLTAQNAATGPADATTSTNVGTGIGTNETLFDAATLQALDEEWAKLKAAEELARDFLFLRCSDGSSSFAQMRSLDKVLFSYMSIVCLYL